MNDIFLAVNKYKNWAISLRRYFHMNPEISGDEYNTQRKIIEELTALDISCRPAGTTGVIAEITGNLPGKTIALRADMDALPIQDTCNAAYKSQNNIACHACGHDGHMAILLGTVRILNNLKEQLPGTYRFIFQPHEEAFPSGAMKMIADGALNDVDAIIGAHIWQPIPLGVVGITYGNLMAAPDKFTIKINGKGGHGSMPHQTVDPTLIAAEIILALNTIISRNISPGDLAVLSIGSVHTGDVFNIIPNTATIEGTVRTFEQTVRETIFQRIKTISQGICSAHQATCEVIPLYGHPAVINNAACSKQVEIAAQECQSPITSEIIPPVMCGEDFSYYLKEVPGAFFLIGTGTDEIIYPHHHPKFDIDEQCIAYGMEVMTNSAIKMASSK